MGIKFTNFATSTIADVGGIAAGDLVLNVQAGDGALFPAAGAGDYFYCVLVSSGGTREIVKCTSRTVDEFTITRAQEGTSAAVFAADSVVEHRVTADSLAVIETIDGVTASGAELSALHSQGAVAADFAKLHAAGATLADNTSAQTLTSKTLTSPVIDTGVSGTAVLDEDDMVSNSATKLATQQSIKAYVDSKYSYTTASPGGDFTGGTVYLSKAGRTVTMTWGTLNHPSSAGPSSAAGIVPAAYRPVASTYNIFWFQNGEGFNRVGVTTAGSISLRYIGYDGASHAETFTRPGSISWVSAS